MITEDEVRQLFCNVPVDLVLSQALNAWMCQVRGGDLPVEVFKRLSDSGLVRTITVRSYSPYGLLIILEKKVK